MITTGRRRAKTRSTLIIIILASLLCYCLGFSVLWVSRLPRPGKQPTPTLDPAVETEMSTTHVPTTEPTTTDTPFLSPTPTGVTPSPSWTPSQTFTPFKTWTGTPTGTATETLKPSLTPTITETLVPSDTPVPPTATDTLVLPTATKVEPEPSPTDS